MYCSARKWKSIFLVKNGWLVWELNHTHLTVPHTTTKFVTDKMCGIVFPPIWWYYKSVRRRDSPCCCCLFLSFWHLCSFCHMSRRTAEVPVQLQFTILWFYEAVVFQAAHQLTDSDDKSRSETSRVNLITLSVLRTGTEKSITSFCGYMPLYH